MRKFNMPINKLEDLVFLKGLRLDFESIADLISVRAREIPDAPYVYFYDDVITYQQMNERSNKVANYLKSRGVRKGDNVAFMISNSPEIYYSMFGVQKLGAIPLPLNYMLKPPEISYVLNDAKPKVAIVGSEFMADFAQGYSHAQQKPIVVEIATGIDHGADITEQTLSAILHSYPSDEALVKQSPNDPFLLIYSSGTTGRPKGILLSNKGELSVCLDMTRIGIFNGDDVMLNVLPMFHVNPLCAWTYPIIYAGGSLVLRKSFSPTDFWPSLTRYGATFCMAAPAMYDYIYNSIDPHTVDLPNLKLRIAFSGAAPLPAELIWGFKEKYNVDIIEGYGLTEATGVSTCNPPLGKKKFGSIGMAFPSQIVEIMDDNNNVLPLGARGEICIWGEANMLGYLNKPDATKETLKDGWLHTGDVGHMDEEGYIYIVDRKKDMICRGDENIYPREIEVVLESNPKISETAVVGVPDKVLGERIKAFVIPKVEGSMTEQEVKDFLKDKLAKNKIPEFVEFRADFPRNKAGKVLKKELKKDFRSKRQYAHRSPHYR
jgi:long-chain acyl-CoA synthetase